MSTIDDEILVKNLEVKLKLSLKSMLSLKKMYSERLRRDKFGVTNAERKADLEKSMSSVSEHILELQKALDRAIDIAGLPEERRKGPIKTR